MESPIHAMRQPPSAATPRRGSAARSDGAAGAATRDRPAVDGVLADVWSVFQQLMLEVPAEQPLVVLATTHCRWLPPDLLRWFGHPQVCKRCPRGFCINQTQPDAAYPGAYVHGTAGMARTTRVQRSAPLPSLIGLAVSATRRRCQLYTQVDAAA